MTYNAQMDMTVLDEELAVVPITPAQAAEMVTNEHYLERPVASAHRFGLMRYGLPVGVVTFGTPASRQVQLSVCRSNPELVLELNRLWVFDDMPRNTESWFVSRALHRLPPTIVVSYADISAGHVGYVYRALNFNYAGLTDQDRKTPKFDRVLPDGKHAREAYRQGLVDPATLPIRRRSRKHRYWLVVGTKRERRLLEQLVTWPKLDWKA